MGETTVAPSNCSSATRLLWRFGRRLPLHKNKRNKSEPPQKWRRKAWKRNRKHLANKHYPKQAIQWMRELGSPLSVRNNEKQLNESFGMKTGIVSADNELFNLPLIIVRYIGAMVGCKQITQTNFNIDKIEILQLHQQLGGVVVFQYAPPNITCSRQFAIKRSARIRHKQ